MTTTSKPRTRRIAGNVHATDGAVSQSGKLPIYECTTCDAQVVWATSKRTGRKYLVNVRRGQLDQRFYMGHDLHDCDGVLADRLRSSAALADAEAQADLNRQRAEIARASVVRWGAIIGVLVGFGWSRSDADPVAEKVSDAEMDEALAAVTTA